MAFTPLTYAVRQVSILCEATGKTVESIDFYSRCAIVHLENGTFDVEIGYQGGIKTVWRENGEIGKTIDLWLALSEVGRQHYLALAEMRSDWAADSSAYETGYQRAKNPMWTPF